MADINFYGYTIFLTVGAGISEENKNNIVERWKEPHRCYHSDEHLESIIHMINRDTIKERISMTDKEILMNVAFFHDAVYIPGSFTNEEESAALFEAMCNPDYEHKQTIIDIILDTQTHRPRTELSRIFCEYDLDGMINGDLNRLIQDGMKVLKEFQKAPYNVFREGRIGFIREYIDSGTIKETPALAAYLNWLQYFKPNVAIYAGSFNPFHKGHYDILKKAETIFDKVILAVGINPAKAAGMTKADYEKIVKNFPVQVQNREIVFFDMFLTEFAKLKAQEGINITLVKGIRDEKDLLSEMTQYRYMEDMCPEVKMMYIPASRDLVHVSSSFIRELEARESGSGTKYLL